MFGSAIMNVKGMIVLSLVLMWPAITGAEDRGSVDRPEFETVCHGNDGIRNKKEIPKEHSSGVFSIEEAVFHLTVSRESAYGRMHLSGRILAGNPRRIPVLGDDIVITAIQEVTGGALVCDLETGPRIFLLPDESPAFRVSLSLTVAARKDTRSKFVSLGIAPALKNLLVLDPAGGISIEVPPGEVDRQGMLHVEKGSELVVRFHETTPL